MFVNLRGRSATACATALPRRPTMLLLLLCLLPAASSETSYNVLFKPINQSCPDTGYFFERGSEEALGPAPCYLCFCNGDDAVCSLRADTRCDKRLHIHQKREIKRVRRAPGGLGDIFFRDAEREIFNKNPVKREECKPHSSKSIGCPPADWCTGCMVCDCDANGRWDCHVMSFCDKSQKSKSVRKTKKSHLKNPFDAHVDQNSSLKKSNKNTGKNNKNTVAGKKIIKKSVNTRSAMPQISVETKKGFRRKDEKDKPLVIKKYISTISPITSPGLLKHKNNTSKLAQLLYQQYMLNMNKLPNKVRKRTITDKNMGDKIMNKKGMFKKNIKPTKMKPNKPMNTKVHKNKPKVMKNKQNKKKDGSKKQIKKSSNFKSKKYMATKFNTSKRSKRDISQVTEQNVNLTKIEETETAKGETFPNGTEISFTVSEDFQTNLNNYAYTVVEQVTPIVVNKNISLHNVTGYVTTARYLEIVTIIEKNSTTRNDVKVKINPATTEIPVLVVNRTDNNLKITPTYNDIFKTTSVIIDNYYKMNVTTANTTTQRSEDLKEDVKRKMYVQDVTKTSSSKNKFNLKKLVKTLNSRIKYTKDNYNFMNKSLVDTKSTHIKIDGTLNDIQNLLERMLHDTKNNKSKERLKTKSLTAIKYLKKLFSKLFSKSRNKTAVEKDAVMTSICENFGPCRINTKKLGIINFKVKELISETLTALNSIKIIKGILKLFDVHTNSNFNSTITEPDFKMHLKNLNAILKDKFSPVVNLTQTQLTQINYIKSNTQIFIKSIGRFASILNDIIGIIKSENEIYKSKQDAIIKNKKINKSLERGDSITKMKRLLLRYNILQNTFLRKMYEALSSVEEKVKTENVRQIQYKNGTVDKTTYKMAIEKYIHNINNNLKKLKDLASRIDSKTRRKRDTRDEDAIEYLLTLMEYLLRSNNPIDTPPVKDGIDMLIEAIRRAPDIKPIPKPVLQYVPIKINNGTNSATSKEENESKSNNENSKENSQTQAPSKPEEDSTDSDIFQDDRRVPVKIGVEVTTTATPNFVDLSDIITEHPSKVYMAKFKTDDNTEKPFNYRTASSVTTRKIADSDTIFIDDDDFKMVQKAEMDLENRIHSGTRKLTENRIEGPKMRQFAPVNTLQPITFKPSKTKLDLINEAYEEEIKEQKDHTTPKATVIIRVKGETGKRGPKITNSDISSITKEIVDEDKEKPIDTEKVVYKKQMDLLNSLDYGTDRSLIEDSDSRDNSPVDRLTNDAFSSYYT